MKTEIERVNSLVEIPEQKLPRKANRRRSKFWKIRADIPKRIYYLMVALSISIPLLLWVGLTYSGYIEPLFLPAPGAVIQRTYELFKSGELITDIKVSLSRVAWGFLISAVISIPLGLLIGSFKSMAGLFEHLAPQKVHPLAKYLARLIMLARSHIVVSFPQITL